MTRLSVNINKIALIRNARGSNFPDLIQFAKDCETFGAEGITVHPRPDERHIRFSDLQPLKDIVQTEFNIEGYPNEKFINTVLQVKPHQVTLVPDPPGVLTSDSGWDTKNNLSLLKEVIDRFKTDNIRVSIFLNPEIEMVEGAAKSGADRIELYTGTYATAHSNGDKSVLEAHRETAAEALKCGLGINAGHDLNLKNLKEYKVALPRLDEVSIGHALVVDSLYYGLKNVISMYLNQLNP